MVCSIATLLCCHGSRWGIVQVLYVHTRWYHRACRVCMLGDGAAWALCTLYGRNLLFCLHFSPAQTVAESCWYKDGSVIRLSLAQPTARCHLLSCHICMLAAVQQLLSQGLKLVRHLLIAVTGPPAPFCALLGYFVHFLAHFCLSLYCC
jgi:hypothetical protein